MNCDQSLSLFDSHLDGELAPTLETELLSHLVECAECRRSLAILEVAGHVIKADTDAPELSDTFSDRLLACISDEPSSSYLKFRGVARWGLIGLGAAAATLFAIGALWTRPTVIAGSKETVSEPIGSTVGDATGGSIARTHARAVRPAVWEPVDKPESRALDMNDWSRMTVMQLLNALGLEQGGDEGLRSAKAMSPANSETAADGAVVEEF